MKKNNLLLNENNVLDFNNCPVEALSLCEDGSSLTIPTKGQFIQISTQEDSTQTVLDIGERQIILNGRFLKTFYPNND